MAARRCVTSRRGRDDPLVSRLHAVLVCLLSCKHSLRSPGDASSPEQLASCPSQEISFLQGDAKYQHRRPPLTPRVQTSLPPPFLPRPRQPPQESQFPRASNPCHLCPWPRLQLLSASDSPLEPRQEQQLQGQEPRRQGQEPQPPGQSEDERTLYSSSV